MHRIAFLVLIVSPVALAGSWSDLSTAFPALPCQDGWAACRLDGSPLDPEMQLDSENRPLPADMRLGWFDLEPTAAFTPFVGLSDYTTAAPEPEPEGRSTPAVAEADPEPQGDPAVDPNARPTPTEIPAPDQTVGSSGGVAVAGDDTTTSGGGSRASGGESTPSAITTGSDGGSDGTGGTSGGRSSGRTGGKSSSGSDESPPAVATNDPKVGSPMVSPPGRRPGGRGPAITTNPGSQEDPPETSSPTSDGEEGNENTKTTEPDDITTVADAPEEPPPEAVTCDDLVALEPAALMGQVSVPQRECLEGRLNTASRQTTKDKISRVLLMDAEARGDRTSWARLMKRHLEDIDRSDPDLCFKYAYYLSKRGASRAHGVIRWSEYALENKAVWSGSTYTSRVYALLKLRAEAASRVWQGAEASYVENRTDKNKERAERYRGITKDYAREWLDYARASGQNTKNALALCISAAGNREFCEGG